MTRDELIILRREATSWIRKLEQLDGFSERRAQIAVPESVSQHEWSAVLGYLEPRRHGKVIARWLPEVEAIAALNGKRNLSELDQREQAGRVAYLVDVRAPQPDEIVWQWVPECEVTRYVGRSESLDARGRRDASGIVEYLVPVGDAGPTDHAGLAELESYRDAVVSLAAQFLVDEEWAAASVHRSLRDGEPLRLPKLPRSRSVIAPARLQLDVQPGERIPYEVVVVLEQFVSQAEMPELKSELGKRERTQTWKNWLISMQRRLAGSDTSSTQRASIRNARRYLHAAATGELRPDKPH